MKVALLCMTALVLAGCSHTPVKLLVPEAKVVEVPPDFYNCPVETNFPNSKKLTNAQVGSLLLKLQQNNMTCANSLNNIKEFLAEAEKKTKE